MPRKIHRIRGHQSSCCRRRPPSPGGDARFRVTSSGDSGTGAAPETAQAPAGTRIPWSQPVGQGVKHGEVGGL